LIDIVLAIQILTTLESNGRVDAVGDNGKAIGALQIHPIMVRECNRITGKHIFNYQDRRNQSKSELMAAVFLRYQIKRFRAKYKRCPTMQEVCCCWNSGNIMKKQPHQYLSRVRKLLESMRSKDSVE
jgi:hypothetical protein